MSDRRQGERRHGRPRLEIDVAEMERRLALGFSLVEILDELDLAGHRRTIQRRIADRRRGDQVPPPPLRRCSWPGCYAYVQPLAPGCTRGHPLD